MALSSNTLSMSPGYSPHLNAVTDSYGSCGIYPVAKIWSVTVPELSAEIWDDVGQEYEAGIGTLGQLERRWPVSRQAIQKRARREGWHRTSPDELARRTDAKLNENASALSGAAASNPAEDPINQRAKLIQKHQRAWTEMDALWQDSVRAALDPAYASPDGEKFANAMERLNYANRLARLTSSLANTLLLAQEGERRAHGFHYRTQQKAAVADEAKQHQKAEDLEALYAEIKKVISTEVEHRVGVDSTAQGKRGWKDDDQNGANAHCVSPEAEAGSDTTWGGRYVPAPSLLAPDGASEAKGHAPPRLGARGSGLDVPERRLCSAVLLPTQMRVVPLRREPWTRIA